MKKILLYILILILITFAIPIIFTKSFEKNKEVANFEENSSNNNLKVQNHKEKENNNSEKNLSNIEKDINQKKDNASTYEYKEYSTVKVLHTKTNQIEELPIDEYIYGVVSAEMPANFEKEALKAQSIVARTYTIYKIMQNNGKHEGADICDDSSCCQAWISKEDRLNKWNEAERENNWNKIVNSVEETKGKIITYNGSPINAFFHSNSGGATEIPVNVWGGDNYPYLQTVETSGEDGYTQYYSEVILSKDELVNKMKSNYSDFFIDFDKEDEIKILEYTGSSRVKTLKIGNKTISRRRNKTNF